MHSPLLSRLLPVKEGHGAVPSALPALHAHDGLATRQHPPCHVLGLALRIDETLPVQLGLTLLLHALLEGRRVRHLVQVGLVVLGLRGLVVAGEVSQAQLVTVRSACGRGGGQQEGEGRRGGVHAALALAARGCAGSLRRADVLCCQHLLPPCRPVDNKSVPISPPCRTTSRAATSAGRGRASSSDRVHGCLRDVHGQAIDVHCRITRPTPALA